MSAFCDMCGRLLTDPKSVSLGVGPECATAYAAQTTAVARVRLTVAAGDFRHSALTRLLQQLGAAEAHDGSRARRDAIRLRGLVANWAAKIEGIYGIALRPLPGLSGDPAERAEDGDAARHSLTTAEQAEADAFDATWRRLAAIEAPLDGCEVTMVAGKAVMA
jgi:hypothetical protein